MIKYQLIASSMVVEKARFKHFWMRRSNESINIEVSVGCECVGRRVAVFVAAGTLIITTNHQGAMRVFLESDCIVKTSNEANNYSSTRNSSL
jgi:mannose-1-phosphate guanylyltransferase